ncbi:MAG: hypothetical protein JJE48_02940 [Actinobacteria bacterium]|nr:hypothetical protein [Actinomycetota bacterium]
MPISGLAYAGVNEAASYLKGRQNADGGLSEPDESSSGILTGWTILAGLSSISSISDPADWYEAGAAAVEYVNAAASEATALTDLELYALALSEAGTDPRNASGKNLLSLIKAHIGDDGKIGKSLDEHCWGIISLVSAGEKVPTKSTNWLVSKQREDGGWADSSKDIVRQTALGVEALVAAGEADADIIRKALKLLREKMSSDGGFAGTTKATDGQLTASVVRAIYAAGDDPASTSWTFEGANPVSFLNSLQAPDGHYRYSSGVESQPAMTTAMVLPALSGKHFPLTAKGVKAPLEGEDTQGEPVHDLGTEGAEAEAGSEPTGSEPTGSEVEPASSSNESAVETGGPAISRVNGASAGAIGQKATWFGGLWLFLIICVAYLVVLAVAALITGKLVSPEKRTVSRTDDFSGF